MPEVKAAFLAEFCTKERKEKKVKKGVDKEKRT